MIKSSLYYGSTFAVIAVLSAALFSGLWIPVALLFIAMASIGSIHYFGSSAQRAHFETLIIFWAVVCPLGYSLLQIPRTSTIITMDRLFAAGALAALTGIALTTGRLPVPPPLRKAAVAWTGFLAVVFFSLRGLHGQELIGTLRMVVEVFVIPSIIALYVLQCFDVKRNIRHLHTAVCIATIYLALIGIAEVKAGTDLLPTAVDRNEYFAGSGDVRLLRANGPYGTNGTYATVGLLNLLFLEFVRRNTSNEITGWRRSMHWTAIACACTVALLPMFRALALTATVVAAVALYQRYGKKSFLPVLGTVALLIVFVLTLKAVSPSLFEERVSDASNFHARLAEYKQGLALFSDHPFFGVGLNQFYASVADRFKYLFYYKGESSLDFPHSLPLALLAETGTVGFLSFVVAQATMLMGFRQLLTYRRTVRGYWAWNVTILIFLTYCGMNVDLVSGYYDELNVWYLFVLAVVVKYGIQQLPPSSSRKQAVRRFIQRSVPSRTVSL